MANHWLPFHKAGDEKPLCLRGGYVSGGGGWLISHNSSSKEVLRFLLRHRCLTVHLSASASN